MLLTKFCVKKQPSAYDVLQNEIGYFDNKKSALAQIKSAQERKLMWGNIPQPVSNLVARLQKDIARVDSMTDVFGQQITRESIAKLSDFLTKNGVKF